jgi:hypothetical protein
MIASAILHSDGSVELSSGQHLRATHPAGRCAGDVCPLHNPTEHPLRALPLYFNGTHMVRLSAHAAGGVLIDPDDYLFLHSGEAILRNSVKCLLCSTEVQSLHRHHYISCECGNVAADGGFNYLRRTWEGDRSTFVDTSIVIKA